jgi:hypothetical protein
MTAMRAAAGPARLAMTALRAPPAAHPSSAGYALDSYGARSSSIDEAAECAVGCASSPVYRRIGHEADLRGR